MLLAALVIALCYLVVQVVEKERQRRRFEAIPLRVRQRARVHAASDGEASSGDRRRAQ